MNRSFLGWVLAAGLLLACPTPVSAHIGHGTPAGAGGCRCPEPGEPSAGAWCEPHRIATILDVRITSRALHEMVDPAGHRIDGDAVTCESCRVGRRDDGACPEHGIWFWRGRGYVSRLGYLVSAHNLGAGVPAEDLEQAREHLLRAQQLADECALCPAAFFARGRCPDCRLDYGAACDPDSSAKKEHAHAP